jgi:hypothetical protein
MSLFLVGIFEETLSQQGTKLFVIGYGFRDRHINQIIKESVKNYGLKLYILSPENPRNFIEKLHHLGIDTILKGLCGYFPYTLSQLFPIDQQETIPFKMIVENLFIEL